MSSTYSINYKKGIENFGGDEEMFKGLIGQFEVLTFNESLAKLYDAMKKKAWIDVRGQAHSLKGTSGYLAAEKFSESALNLQLAAESQIEKDIKERYLQLMHEAKALKINIAKLMDKEPYTDEIDRYSINDFREYIQYIYLDYVSNILFLQNFNIFLDHIQRIF